MEGSASVEVTVASGSGFTSYFILRGDDFNSPLDWPGVTWEYSGSLATSPSPLCNINIVDNVSHQQPLPPSSVI